MEYLEVKTNSIIMIEFKNGTSEPFLVYTKKLNRAPVATLVFGDFLSDLILKRLRFLCPLGGANKFGLESKRFIGMTEDFCNYRELTHTEKNEWLKKLELVGGLENLISSIL